MERSKDAQPLLSFTLVTVGPQLKLPPPILLSFAPIDRWGCSDCAKCIAPRGQVYCKFLQVRLASRHLILGFPEHQRFVFPATPPIPRHSTP